MALRSTSFPSILLILLFIAFFNTLCHLSFEYSPDVVRLHDVLTSFTTRGQTAVELFAPLSTIVGSSPNGRVLLTVATHIAWPLVGIAFLRLLRIHKLIKTFGIRMALYVLIAGTAWLSGADRHEHLLSMVRHQSLLLWMPFPK